MFDTLANVDAYHSERGNTAWAAVTDDATRTAYIVKATDWMSRYYNWPGLPVTPEQLDAWPRTGVFYQDGTEIASDVVPAAVKRAVAIAADLFRRGFKLDGERDATGIIKKKKIDVIETEYDTAYSTSRANPAPVTEVLLAAGLILADGELQRV